MHRPFDTAKQSGITNSSAFFASLSTDTGALPFLKCCASKQPTKVQQVALLFSFTLLLGLSACSDTEMDNTPTDFNRSGMLENYSENLITPAYAKLEQEVQNLQQSWEAFESTPSETSLQVLRANWTSTYLAWQDANSFNFGPAAAQGSDRGLLVEIGTFPVDIDQLEQNITAGRTDLSTADPDAKGFLALEYLLFQGTAGDTGIMNRFNEANYVSYTSLLITDIKDRVEQVANAWSAYSTDFIANDGTDAGSSTSILYNEFVKSFENLKNFKVGLPAGKRPGQLTTEPQLVEARVSQQSISTLEAHLSCIERIYYGTSLSGVGNTGLQDYLASVEGGPDLIILTEAQLQDVREALAALPEGMSLVQLLEQEDERVEELHDQLQRLTRFFKSDMSSLLGIAITYDSGDGD